MVIKRPPPPKRSSQSSEIRTSYNDTRTHSEARSFHSDRSSHSSESNMRTSVSSDRRIPHGSDTGRRISHGEGHVHSSSLPRGATVTHNGYGIRLKSNKWLLQLVIKNRFLIDY